MLRRCRIGRVAEPAAQGNRILRAYVCDGWGPPEGVAVWFRADVEGALPDSGLTITSAGGQETMRVTSIRDRGVYGAFIDSTGTMAAFAAYPAFDGAGIYQVTLDESLRYTGTSTTGDVLDAKATSDGTTQGTITTDGRQLGFTVHSPVLADPARLAQYGLPDTFKELAADNQVPGEYVAVIAPGGTHWFGRNGAVRDGEPGRSIIGLDKKPR